MSNLEQGLPEPPGKASSSEDGEAALLAALLRKDRKATAEFVSRNADAVYSFVRFRVAPRYDVVDDLVQEVFLAAWENITDYRGTGSLRGWLMGIARHKVEDYYRGLLRAPEPLEETELDTAMQPAMPDFESRLDQEELRGRTWRVMASLSEPYRAALIWRYWEKVSAREMAERAGRTEKAIERLLARAREQFRERWTRA